MNKSDMRIERKDIRAFVINPKEKTVIERIYPYGDILCLDGPQVAVYDLQFYQYAYKGGTDVLFSKEEGDPFLLMDEEGVFTVHRGFSVLFPNTVVGTDFFNVHQFREGKGFLETGRVQWTLFDGPHNQNDKQPNDPTVDQTK